MSDLKAVLAHNLGVLVVASLIWYIIYDKTGSLWSLLAFVFALPFHVSQARQSDGKANVE